MDVLSERLRAAADPIFRAQLEHPFVQGIDAVRSQLGCRRRTSRSPPGSRRYAADDFAELARWCRDALDELATTTAEDRLRESFLVSNRYELAFWEMAWRREAQPPA
jgi:thiaminase